MPPGEFTGMADGMLQGYPDGEEELTFTVKQKMKKTSGVLKGYTAWKTKQSTVRSLVAHLSNPGTRARQTD
jgi:hypothetical protein